MSAQIETRKQLEVGRETNEAGFGNKSSGRVKERGADLRRIAEVANNLVAALADITEHGSGINRSPDVRRGIDFYEEVRFFEINLIGRALELTGGHQGKAARLLNMKITTLNNKIKQYGIPFSRSQAV
ncbi:MAG: helix-turn-helix domain-containing protein [Pyrinomonadaceae bacterium]|nr:helix-turn-helix domain-containing protein [Pyrinomonadaceae bacterium]